MVMEIPLTQGKIALVDDEDYEMVSRFKWYAHNPYKNLWYAMRSGIYYGGVTTQQHRLHSDIMECPVGLVIDHIDGDGLNNQKYNLRVVTNRVNCQNHHRVTSSRYPGVSWHTSRGYWVAYAKLTGINTYLGCYQNEYDAYIAYKTFVDNLPKERIGMIP